MLSESVFWCTKGVGLNPVMGRTNNFPAKNKTLNTVG